MTDPNDVIARLFLDRDIPETAALMSDALWVRGFQGHAKLVDGMDEVEFDDLKWHIELVKLGALKHVKAEKSRYEEA